MNYFQIKDYVREHFGRTGIDTAMLDLYLEASRLIIENHGNFWWMQNEVTFNATDGVSSYAIGDGSAIDIPRFKDAKVLHWREVGDNNWEPVDLGSTEKDVLDLMYQTDDTGSPEAAAIVDDTLFLYPPDPNDTFNMKLFYWNYTDFPVITGEDELTKNFPMALIYGALAHGYEMYLKDTAGAGYWRALLGGTPFGRGGELVKIKKMNFQRGWKDQITLTPRTGPGRHPSRLDNAQIYGNRWS
jgi:hypothetical protein